MHEWALVEAVLAAASEIAEKEKLREVTELRIRVGELQQVEPSILEFAFSQLKSGKFRNAKVTIGTERAKLKCRACENGWVFSKEELDEDVAEAVHLVPEVAHAYVRCPKCGSPDFEVVEGRGVVLETVKGVK
jgi:hydrogenase nickel incorporation protein HypA/HybF